MSEKSSSRSWVIARGFIAWAFAIALGLLYVLVLRSLAVQISPPPEPLTEPYPDVSTEETCETAGGRWIPRGEVVDPAGPRPAPEPVPYCQGPLTFERERQAQSEASQQTSLFVFALGGALAVAGALLLKQLRPVAPGLMLGGIASFLITGFHVWTLTPGIGRLITIVAVFAVLVTIGMRVFQEHE